MTKHPSLDRIANLSLRAFVRHAKPLATANRAKKVSERLYQIEFTEPNNAEYVGRLLAEKVNRFRPTHSLKLSLPPLGVQSCGLTDTQSGWSLRLMRSYDPPMDRTCYFLDVLIRKQPMRKRPTT